MDFIATIKDLIRKATKEEPGYVCLKIPYGKGLKIGDTYIYAEPCTSGKQIYRVFAPQSIAIKRVDETGNIINKKNDV